MFLPLQGRVFPLVPVSHDLAERLALCERDGHIVPRELAQLAADQLAAAKLSQRDLAREGLGSRRSECRSSFLECFRWKYGSHLGDDTESSF